MSAARGGPRPARPRRLAGRWQVWATAAALMVLGPGARGAPLVADAAALRMPPPPLRGETMYRGSLPNPHAHIPAQCHVETSHGQQNACLFCHTDGVWQRRLGNNNPQAGANPNLGNLQTQYAFGVYDHPFVPNSSINPWINTLQPQVLRAAVARLGEHPAAWDMLAYMRSDNWAAAYAQRPRQGAAWDSGVDHPMRLFPALDPADLPAGPDGFVRTRRTAGRTQVLWRDASGAHTGWRAVNFMPYGIFTPMAGSVSGIYLRLPTAFMKNAAGAFDQRAYEANLELLERNIQDRLRAADPPHYGGGAAGVAIVRGQYPLGTEFAHPLHYVDVAADGRDARLSPFPGTRSRRVKEIRWMLKVQAWHPGEFGMALKDESAPIHAHPQQGWIENGAGWLLAGWIEDARGALRPQTPSELVQCVGCHSGNVRQSEIGQHATFTSGSGNTIDSTWALPRKFAGATGWREMDYLGYVAPRGAEVAGSLTTPEPLNRGQGRGEFGFFLDHVVGASLYGEMPAAMEAWLETHIRRTRGYSADWPALEPAVAGKDVEAIARIQTRRRGLMRELTARGEYKDGQGRIHAALLVPTPRDALEAARRYRQVVVTQRYDFGKDVFPDTPFTLRYFRRSADAFTHQDGRPYAIGEVITDRPVNASPGDFTYGVGVTPTLIDDTLLPGDPRRTFVPDYVPLLGRP